MQINKPSEHVYTIKGGDFWYIRKFGPSTKNKYDGEGGGDRVKKILSNKKSPY